MPAKLWAVSDIHVGHKGNRPVTEAIEPENPEDWLIVAGDVSEKTDDIRWALAELKSKFDTVIWVPGNHELWTTVKDPVQMHGEARYDYLVTMCRELGVLTPEDPFPVWEGEVGQAGGRSGYLGPVTLVPMFVLYDYSFLPAGTTNKLDGLALARSRNVVATDEFLITPTPYASLDAWCAARLAITEKRLAEVDTSIPTVLINHWPLVRQPTEVLFYPEFALWCGTTATKDWHTRYNALCAVYGHLHIPRTTYYDGVRFEEVSVGYPREWKRRGLPDQVLRQILPVPEYPPGSLNKFGGHFTVTPEMEAEVEKMRAEKRL
ncbi:metallophosphoesterase [Rhodococcus sp. BP-332]|uniref:metallophosphoesterase family protein n=1 Tax=Rhodococcus sp. BP-332 TaxID=2739447 RepID=UPI001C9B29C1|nr:metallophosphoesterase [Rhodococcus sp. BP-332]MBY6675753.1 metallophosphoesterase [Rhodococcus sp. BP-332]